MKRRSVMVQVEIESTLTQAELKRLVAYALKKLGTVKQVQTNSVDRSRA